MPRTVTRPRRRRPPGSGSDLVSICPRCGRLFAADTGGVCPECGFPLTAHLDRRVALRKPDTALARYRDRQRDPLERY